MKSLLFILIFTFCLCGNAVATDESQIYTLYLIRHAEKELDTGRIRNPDPVLTEAGKNRSARLAWWFRDKRIKDIWSSDYHRTRDTAKPIVEQLGLALNSYDPGNQLHLVKQLSERKHNALIIGHSNTIPELARFICKCEIAAMDNSEHDRMIVITVANDATMVRTLNQQKLFHP